MKRILAIVFELVVIGGLIRPDILSLSNLSTFLIWFSFSILILSILTEEGRMAYFNGKKKQHELEVKYHNFSNMIVTALLVINGRFITAGFYLFAWLSLYLIYLFYKKEEEGEQDV